MTDYLSDKQILEIVNYTCISRKSGRIDETNYNIGLFVTGNNRDQLAR